MIMISARQVLLYAYLASDCDWQKTYSALADKTISDVSKDIMLDKIKDIKDNEYITITDTDYKETLMSFGARAPFVLFYKGDISLLKETDKMLCAIGERNLSDYASDNLKNILSELPKETIIVSSLNNGTGRKALTGAIANGHKVIAFMGSGINYCYPSSCQDVYDFVLQSGGLILSPYPLKTTPTQEMLAYKNMILGGVCKNVFLVEADKMSGLAITCNVALINNANIMCLPHNANGKGGLNNLLIKEGAYLVENANDIIDVMGDLK